MEEKANRRKDERRGFYTRYISINEDDTYISLTCWPNQLDPDGYWIEIIQNEALKKRVNW